MSIRTVSGPADIGVNTELVAVSFEGHYYAAG